MICLVLLAYVLPAFSGEGRYTDLSFDESISGVNEDCPRWILDNQVLVDVVYWGFDGGLYHGQFVADNRVVGDLQMVFMLMFLTEFPIESVVPISEYDWDDGESMRQNNTSAFNYRCVGGTDRLSRHAFGLAIDINPYQNPYYSGQCISPEGSVYDTSMPGTLYDGHPVVELLKLLGWRWGGDWQEKDYQHFDKQLEEIELHGVQNHRPWPMGRLL